MKYKIPSRRRREVQGNRVFCCLRRSFHVRTPVATITPASVRAATKSAPCIAASSLACVFPMSVIAFDCYRECDDTPFDVLKAERQVFRLQAAITLDRKVCVNTGRLHDVNQYHGNRRNDAMSYCDRYDGSGGQEGDKVSHRLVASNRIYPQTGEHWIDW